MIKLNLKKKLLISVLSLFTISSCFNANSSSSNTTLTASSTSVSSSDNLVASDQVKLVAVEVDKLPTRINYLSTEVISTSGGVLRVVYSDYRVRYVSMNDAMIEVSRLNTSSVGTSRVTLRYEELGTTLFTSYQINIIPFKVALQKVELDIISSDVAFEQKVDLNYIIYPLNAYYQQVEWSSSNELIARVDSNGVVTPINQGEVLISVKVDNNFTATSKLNILPMQPREIQLNPTFVSLIEQGWIPLSSANDLATIDNNLSSSSYVFAANTSYAVTVENKTSAQMLDLNYFLVNNIDLSSIANWTPLGTFTGELDGKGFNIMNMNVNLTNTSNLGLFSSLNGTSISNLNLVDFNVTLKVNGNVKSSNFGLLSGTIANSNLTNLNIKRTNQQSSTIFVDYSSASGLAEANRPEFFGGITGQLSVQGTFTNVSVDTKIYTQHRTGGFIGNVHSLTSPLSLNESSFLGEIVRSPSNLHTAQSIGGFFGRVLTTNTINIENSSVKSSILLREVSGVEKRYWEVGGFIGIFLSANLNIYRSSYLGNISSWADGSKFIARVFSSGDISIEDSYNIGNVTTDITSNGSIIGYNRLGGSSLTIRRVYSIGNVVRTDGTNIAIGLLFGTNGDTIGDGSGTIVTQNVYFSNEGTNTTSFVIGAMTRPVAGVSNLTGSSALTNTQLKNINNFNTWDFNTVWRINPNINNGYPYLAWEE
jgi:hypothetical protein